MAGPTASSAEVLDFWRDEVGPSLWYKADSALDERIRARFAGTWTRMREGGLRDWTVTPAGALAYVIVTDQFPRNMHRGSAEAFATDTEARAAAKRAVAHGFDLRIAEPERQFFYLPLMHSECLGDQERCVRLMKTRLTQGGADNLLHARVHRAVIRRFGRFPYRNAALGRASTPGEAAFLEEDGYQKLVGEMRPPKAAA